MDDGVLQRRRWQTLILVSVAQFMVVLDASINLHRLRLPDLIKRRLESGALTELAIPAGVRACHGAVFSLHVRRLPPTFPSTIFGTGPVFFSTCEVALLDGVAADHELDVREVPRDVDVATLHQVAAAAVCVSGSPIRMSVPGCWLSGSPFGPLRRTSMLPLRTVLPQIWTVSLVRSGSMSSSTRAVVDEELDAP